ncbi:MAG: DUF309 domain-containing protein [Candidatus Methylomirabilales bacterium]
MKLQVRNTLSELLLEALPAPEKVSAIQGLLAYCRAAEGQKSTTVPFSKLAQYLPEVQHQTSNIEHRTWESGVGEEALKRLQALNLFQVQDGSIELLPEFQTDLPAVRRRMEAYLKVLSHAGRDQEARGWGLEQAIRDAALLFNEGLYFEFHELLEAFWMPEENEGQKRLLQGLIQIAVAFHHLFNKNYRGAFALLQDGLEKAQGSGPRFYGLRLDEFLEGVKTCLAALERDPHTFEPGFIPRMTVQGSGFEGC